jgi:acyl-CoA synthetase (AMP-forming)/AMP-acid ligase II
VKLRGFRIELGEIEAALERLHSVRQAIVLAWEDSPGHKRLIAYVTATNGQSTNSGTLREKLRERLPEYMIPASFISIEHFPLTPNGKVDHFFLQEPFRVSCTTRRPLRNERWALHK